MNVLRQKSISVAMRESIYEEIARLFTATEPPPSVNPPESASEVRRLMHAEIVFIHITHYMLAAQMFSLDRCDSMDETWIVGLNHAGLRYQQNAGVEMVVSKRC